MMALQRLSSRALISAITGLFFGMWLTGDA